MSLLSHDRYCAEIVAQTDLLRSTIEGADLTVPGAVLPGLERRPAAAASRRRPPLGRDDRTDPGDRAPRPTSTSATSPRTPTRTRPCSAPGSPRAPGSWRTRCAPPGPTREVWTPVPGGDGDVLRPPLCARDGHPPGRRDPGPRRGVHRRRRGRPSTPSTSGWSSARCRRSSSTTPSMRELLGPGRTLHFHATDTAPEAAAEWLVDLTGDAIAWRRAHEKAAVAVRGPLTDLLLVVYRRRPGPRGRHRDPRRRGRCSTSGWSGSASADPDRRACHLISRDSRGPGPWPQGHPATLGDHVSSRRPPTRRTTCSRYSLRLSGLWSVRGRVGIVPRTGW